MTDATCIVMRREGDRYSTRGPMAEPMPLHVAHARARELAALFPGQEFVVMGLISEVRQISFINTTVVEPALPEPPPEVARIPSRRRP